MQRQRPFLPPSLEINGKRLMQRLMALGDIGLTPENGVSRLAFTPEDRQARSLVHRWMVAAGMTVRIDAAGNLIGRYEGDFPKAPTLATGSHLDTVPNAGRYDGAYGVIAGLEVVQTLCDRNLRLDHPIDVMVFADEEATMIGSKAMAGLLSVVEDASLLQHLDHIGGDGARLATAQRRPGSMAAFVEVHVEQGPVLESRGGPVGVVTGIVGQRRYSITIIGQASHAGTTPMTLRRDALVAAAQIVLAVQAMGMAKTDGLTGEQVATVGAVTVLPNVANTVPDQVTLSVDMRDLSLASLWEMEQRLEQQASVIAARTGTHIRFTPKLCNPPVLASSHIQNTITQACDRLGLPICALPSRASHDAQNMARLTDMGMIFVQSQHGLSHSPQEHTPPEDCIRGANVLLHSLIQLDQHYCIRRDATDEFRSSYSLIPS